MFAAVILQTTPGVRKAADIRRRLEGRMDLWARGNYVSLVDDTEAEVLNRGSGGDRRVDEETRARAFNAKILSGRGGTGSNTRRQRRRSPAGGRLHQDGAPRLGGIEGEASTDEGTGSSGSGSEQL